MTVEEIIQRGTKWGKEGIWFVVYKNPRFTKILDEEILLYQVKILLRAPEKNNQIRFASKVGEQIHQLI